MFLESKFCNALDLLPFSSVFMDQWEICAHIFPYLYMFNFSLLRYRNSKKRKSSRLDSSGTWDLFVILMMTKLFKLARTIFFFIQWKLEASSLFGISQYVLILFISIKPFFFSFFLLIEVSLLDISKERHMQAHVYIYIYIYTFSGGGGVLLRCSEWLQSIAVWLLIAV